MAPTDPSTLDPAFMAHAHSIIFSEELAWFSPEADIFSLRARRPVGKGIPIMTPRGSSAAVGLPGASSRGKHRKAHIGTGESTIKKASTRMPMLFFHACRPRELCKSWPNATVGLRVKKKKGELS